MVVVFTSKAFNDWIARHVQAANGTSFNPYLTFLFIALYVAMIYPPLLMTDLSSCSAGLSAIRFLGSFLYLVFRLFGF